MVIGDPALLQMFFLFSCGRRVHVGEDAVGLSDFFGQARGHYPAVRHLEELIFDRGTSRINHKNDHDVTSVSYHPRRFSKSMTIRPSISPRCMRAKISLMLSSGSVAPVALTLPSLAKFRASCRSRRVPTIEPRTVIPLKTGPKIDSGKSTGGR